MNLEHTVDQLVSYLEKRDYQGYDPYDALNIPLPWHSMGRMLPALTIQLFKRLPVNLRPMLGCPRGHNPKAMGLFLHAFSILYGKTGAEHWREKADFFYNWLIKNYSRDYPGMSWGYNFRWISPIRNLPAYTPSAVVTAFVCRGLHAYQQVTQKEEVSEVLRLAADFVLKALPIYSDRSGLSFSYTPRQEEVCYNASLLAAEILALHYLREPNDEMLERIDQASGFVLSRQLGDGSWNYSEVPQKNSRRRQTDFHQGYILESLDLLRQVLTQKDQILKDAVTRGLLFYRSQQFLPGGQPRFRLPDNFPADIHHAAQGILTFKRLSAYDSQYSTFADQVLTWTLENMRASSGYFYYRKYRVYTNKVSYVRWGQAWMLLALAEAL